MTDTVVRCAACDGYGWIDDEDAAGGDVANGENECRWCAGIGYVYRDEHGVSRRIPESDYAALGETLERLEIERMREIGYTGESKPMSEQGIRKKRD